MSIDQAWVDVWLDEYPNMVRLIGQDIGPDDAHDVVMDAWLACLDKKPNPYYFRVAARNKRLNFIRDRRAHRHIELTELHPPTFKHNGTLVADTTAERRLLVPLLARCPVCDEWHDPHRRRDGTVATCGRPRCVATLRERRRRAASN